MAAAPDPQIITPAPRKALDQEVIDGARDDVWITPKQLKEVGAPIAPHAATHAAAGSDPIAPAAIGAVAADSLATPSDLAAGAPGKWVDSAVLATKANQTGFAETLLPRSLPRLFPEPLSAVYSIAASLTLPTTYAHNAPEVTFYGPTYTFSGSSRDWTGSNSTGQRSLPAWSWAFVTASPQIEILFRPPGTSGIRYQLLVDGLPVTPDAVNHAYQSSNIVKLSLDFGYSRSRKIEMVVGGLSFGGAAVVAGYNIASVPPNALKVCLFGDSWFGGANNTYLPSLLPLIVARAFAWEPMINGIGGTGYISGAYPYTDTQRKAAIISWEPSVIVIFGSINDGPNPTAVQAAAAALYADIASALPAAKIIVVGPQPMPPGSYPSNAARLANRDAVRTAALAAGNVIGFIDPIAEGWLTGSGNVDFPNGTGNADYYVNSDGAHLSRAGAYWYAARLIERIEAIGARAGLNLLASTLPTAVPALVDSVGVQIDAAVQPVAASRAPVDYVQIDGATSGRRIVMPMPALAGSPITEGPHFFRVPTTAFPGTGGYIFYLGNGSTTTPWVNGAHTLSLYINTDGVLQLREDTGVGSNVRSMNLSGFRSTYAGQIVGVVVSILPGTANPTIWLWTQATGWQDRTADFVAGVVNTPPGWMGSGLVTTYRLLGLGLLAGEFRPGPITNRASAQTDIDYLAATGRMPPLDELPGSAENKILDVSRNSDFSAGATDWAGLGTGGSVALDSGGLTISSDGSANVGGVIGGAYFSAVRNGRRYRISFDVLAAGFMRLYWVGVSPGLITEGTWPVGSFVVETTTGFTTGTLNGIGIVRPGSIAGSVTIDNFRIVDVGTLAASEINWTAQARGKTNGIHATLTPGVTPMPARLDPIAPIDTTISATGYLLGTTGPHVYIPHRVREIVALAAANTTITIRRNATSGGTPIVNAVSLTAGVPTVLTHAAGTADGNAGDYYHVTLSTATAVALSFDLRTR